EHGKKVPGLIEGLAAGVPMARHGKAEEVARLVLFLASDEASYRVGQGALVDGGVAVVCGLPPAQWQGPAATRSAREPGPCRRADGAAWEGGGGGTVGAVPSLG